MGRAEAVCWGVRDGASEGDWRRVHAVSSGWHVSVPRRMRRRVAVQGLRRAAGGDLDDDALLLAMARQAHGTHSDDGRSSYRITYQVCPACGRGAQVAGGELVAVGPDVLDMAACDGECIQLQPAPAADESRVAAANDTEAAACATTTHVGRARQAVPPALRRAVLARDRTSCRVPGCKNTHFVDVHHLQPRSEGGKNTIENLITLCTAHHRATHRGELIIETTAEGLGYQHADGTAYGGAISASSIAAHTKVFGALRNLGFREREVRAVLTEIRSDTRLRDAPTEQLLREALCRIRRAPQA